MTIYFLSLPAGCSRVPLLCSKISMLLRNRLFSTLLLPASLTVYAKRPILFTFSVKYSTRNPSPSYKPNPNRARHASASKSISDAARFVRTVLFVPPGVDPDEVTEEMVLPGSNIVIGPYAGHAQIKEVEFVKGSNRPKDCPRDGRPEFAVLGRSNVGKSSLINALVRKKEVALTSKKPGLVLFCFGFRLV